MAYFTYLCSMVENTDIRIHWEGRMQHLSPAAVDTLTYDLIGSLTRWALHDIPGLRVTPEDMADIASDIYASYLTEDIRGKYNAGLGPWHLFIKTFVRRRVIDRVRRTARNWKNALISLEDAPATEVQASLAALEEQNTAYAAPTEPVAGTPTWSQLPLHMRRKILTAYRAGWLPESLVRLYGEHLTLHTQARRSPAPATPVHTDVMAPLMRPKRRRTGCCALSRLTPGLQGLVARTRRHAWQFIPRRHWSPPSAPSADSRLAKLNERRCAAGLPPIDYDAYITMRRHRRYDYDRWCRITATFDGAFVHDDPEDSRMRLSWNMLHRPRDWESHMRAVMPPFPLH